MVKSSLNRIILIDSLVTGKAIEINVRNHANLSGTNGAGKTSLLRTIPVFYGAKSSQLIAVDGNNVKFVDHYLPKPTSLLVFEYSNHRGSMCSVMYRNTTGEKPVYRFLSEPFSEEHFSEVIDGQRYYIEGKKIGAFWTLLGLQSSSQIESVVDYKNIIQGDKEGINRSADKGMLSRLANMYAISGGIGKMRHMEKIGVATLSQRGDFDALKEMLSSIMQEDNIQMPGAINYGDIKKSLVAIPIIQELRANEDFFKKVIISGQLYIENSKRKDYLWREISTIKNNISSSIGAKKAEISEIEELLVVDLATWDNLETSLLTNLRGLKSSYTGVDENIQFLSNQSNAWEDEDIESKKAEHSQLPQYHRELEGATDRVKILEIEVTDISQEFDKAAIKEDRRHAEAINAIKDKSNLLTQELSAAEQKYLEDKHNLSMLESKEISAEQELRNEELAELSEKIGSAKNESLSNAQTNQEKFEWDTAESERNQADKRRVDLDKARSASDAALKVAKSSMEKSHDIWRSAVKVVSILEDELNNLVNRLNPKNGTLLAELRNTEGHSLENISKIINPDLLDRRDLSPVYSGIAISTVMGFDLDLSKVEKPSWALTAEDQEVELRNKESAIVAARNNADQLESVYKKLLAEFKQAELAKENCERKVSEVERQIASAIESLYIITQRNKDASNDRKKHAEVLLNQLTNQKKAVSALLTANIEKIRDRYRDSFNECLGTFSVIKNRIKTNIDFYVSETNSEIENHKSIKQQMKRDYEALCSEKGLSDSAISDARSSVNKLKSKIEKIGTYKQKIDDYEKWLTNQWPKMDSFVQDLHRIGTAVSVAESELVDARLSHSQVRQGKLSRQAACNSEIKSLMNELGDCNVMLTRLQQPVDKSTIDSPRMLTFVITESEQVLQSQDSLKTEIDIGIKKAERIINQSTSDNQVAIAWDLLYQDAKTRSTQEGLNLNLTIALDTLISTNLNQLQDAVSSIIANIGASLKKHYNDLKSVSENIASQSKKVSKLIGSRLNFDAITDVSLQLKSKVDTQGYWPPLDEFQRAWTVWEDSNSEDLPPKEVTDKLILAYDLLQKYQPDNRLESMFDLKVCAIQNGKYVEADNATKLANISSKGLSGLILFSLLAGMTRLLCKDENILIHWPIDELGILDEANLTRLFGILDSYGIIVLGGFPSSNPNVLRNFKERHQIRKGVGIIKIILPEDRLMNLYNSKKLSASEAGESV